jgi:hypothetical protein
MAGITKRHCQRLLIAGRVPDAVRTDGGHWLIPDNAKVRKWIAKTKDSKHERKATRVYSVPVVPIVYRAKKLPDNGGGDASKIDGLKAIHRCQKNLKIAALAMQSAIDSARENAHAAGLIILQARGKIFGKNEWRRWLSDNGIEYDEAKDLMNFAKWCERPLNKYTDDRMVKKFGIIRSSKNDEQSGAADWRDKKDEAKPQWLAWAGKLCGFVNVTTKQRPVDEWCDTEKEVVRLQLKTIADFYEELSR